MKNLFWYLKKYGNISFDQSAFNDVDALIFSELSYLNLEEVLIGEKEIPFTEIICRKNSKTLVKNTFSPRLEKRLIRMLSSAKRYEGMIFSFPLWKEVPESLTQYFSFCLSEKGKQNYFIFRGTNKTVFGSLENLAFATKKGPVSLSIALDYLNPILENSHAENILIGHSKGGTIAEAAFMRMTKEQRQKVIRVYNFDGPGIWHLPDNEVLSELSLKVKKFITKRTVFGLLLKNCHDYQIADGKNFWLSHHVSFSWKINGTEIASYPRISSRSYQRRKRLNDFVSKLNDEEIVRIIDNSRYLMMNSGMLYIRDIALIRILRFFKVYRNAKKKYILSPIFKEFLFVCKDTFL